jgi:hypothetical protein
MAESVRAVAAILIKGLPMLVNSSSNASRHKKSERNFSKEFLGGLVGFCLCFLPIAWFALDDKYSSHTSVIATVDEWKLFHGGGHGGGVGNYSIKVTLPDGSKGSATAHPLGPEPPRTGQKIHLVKIVSALGFTSYRWERPYWTWDEATIKANK